VKKTEHNSVDVMRIVALSADAPAGNAAQVKDEFVRSFLATRDALRKSNFAQSLAIVVGAERFLCNARPSSSFFVPRGNRAPARCYAQHGSNVWAVFDMIRTH
jgi:hypothetical protein